jgi:hypothetical protein
MRGTLEERFWEKVDIRAEDECWPWTASKNRDNGYGRIKFEGKYVLAHRIAYSLAYGPIPPGMEVCHSCDNPGCVSKFHLFLGTRLDNVRDMIEKGRGVFLSGGKHGCAKLKQSQVDEIHQLYKTGRYHQTQLAGMFGVGQPHISRIVRGEQWK